MAEAQPLECFFCKRSAGLRPALLRDAPVLSCTPCGMGHGYVVRVDFMEWGVAGGTDFKAWINYPGGAIWAHSANTREKAEENALRWWMTEYVNRGRH